MLVRCYISEDKLLIELTYLGSFFLKISKGIGLLSIQQQLKHSFMHSKVCMYFLVKYKIDFENWIFAIFKDQKKFLIKYLL